MLAPRLSAMKDRFGAQGLSVVGITTDPAEKAALFAERNQMRYGVVVDEDGDTSKTYGITSLPTMLVVDKRGVVREVYVGYDPGGEARLEAVIKELLAEPTSGPTGPDGSTSYAPTVPEPTSRPRPGAR
jgi:peroxiredoxin